MRKMVLLLGMLLLTTGLTLSAQASAWNEKTIFTFSGPVEIPGRVLAAGTYVFTLADSISDRDIVQIWQGKDKSKLLATILAIPDERMKPTSKPVITFEERPTGSPQAVQAWFYPGRLIGEEFVYPKAKAVELAKRTNQAVLSIPDETKLTAEELKKAPVKVEKPTGEEVEVGELVIPPSQAELAPSASTQTTASAEQPSSPNSHKRLPKTASELPLIALLGLLSLCCAGGLCLVGKRVV